MFRTTHDTAWIGLKLVSENFNLREGFLFKFATTEKNMFPKVKTMLQASKLNCSFGQDLFVPQSFGTTTESF